MYHLIVYRHTQSCRKPPIPLECRFAPTNTNKILRRPVKIDRENPWANHGLQHYQSISNDLGRLRYTPDLFIGFKNDHVTRPVTYDFPCVNYSVLATFL